MAPTRRDDPLLEIASRVGQLVGSQQAMNAELNRLNAELMRMATELNTKHRENIDLIESKHKETNELIEAVEKEQQSHKEKDEERFGKIFQVFTGFSYIAAFIGVLWAVIKWVWPLIQQSKTLGD